MTDIPKSIDRYLARTGYDRFEPRAVLFDMDGVLYDSMPGHARAWKGVCDSIGIDADENEFFAHEGRTGAATIDILIRRAFRRPATEEECRRLYRLKTELFAARPNPVPCMPGASEAVDASVAGGCRTVLVTGSGQGSLLQRLESDYPDAFPEGRRVTGNDVKHGKPDPEPYLKGIGLANVENWQAIGVDNAPLGVESSSEAGLFTIGVRTGPIEHGSLLAAGADIEVDGMEECARIIRTICPPKS